MDPHSPLNESRNLLYSSIGRQMITTGIGHRSAYGPRKVAEARVLQELMTGTSDAEWSSAWHEGYLVLVNREGDHASFAGDDSRAPPQKTSMAAWSMIRSRALHRSIGLDETMTA